MSVEMDVLFVIDATGSMGSTLSAAHDRAASIAAQLKTEHSEIDFLFGSVCYRDPVDSRGDKNEFSQLHPDINMMVKFLHGQHATGGGDSPEDWVGALTISLNKITWRTDSKKMMIIIADAPAHGKQFCGYSNHEDQTPLLIPLIAELAHRDILVNGLSINGGADCTFKEFKKIYEDNNGKKFTFESFTVGYSSSRATCVIKTDQLGRNMNDEDYPKDDPDDDQYDLDPEMENVPPRKNRPPQEDETAFEGITSLGTSGGVKTAEDVISSKLAHAAADLVVSALET